MTRYRGVVLCSQRGCREWKYSLIEVLRRCFDLLRGTEGDLKRLKCGIVRLFISLDLVIVMLKVRGSCERREAVPFEIAENGTLVEPVPRFAFTTSLERMKSHSQN